DKRNQVKLEAELVEWKAKLKINDPGRLREVEQKMERIRSDNGWDNPETGLSGEEVKILELGEQWAIMQKIGSNPPKWTEKKERFRNLYRKLALSLNKIWNAGDRSKL
ncbi:hypothetical protein H0H93_004647, partial [Arthromyces matolae]